MGKDIQAYVRSCPVCQVMKSDNRKKAGLLQPIPIPSRKWEQITTDLVTDLPPCARKGGKNGNGKETGKNAFLSFPVPTNFDQRKSVLPTLRADIFVIRHLFSILFFATDLSSLRVCSILTFKSDKYRASYYGLKLAVEMCAEMSGKKQERERNWKERVSFLSRSYKF